jgi:lipopolysaccharide biosynthesis protein
MHLIRKLSWAFNRRFLAPAPEPPPALRVDPKRARVCCLAHVYYGELWEELAAHIRNFDPIPVDLRVNVAQRDGCEALVRRVQAAFPHAVVKISPNRGRDIGGFFSLLRDVHFERYDLFCLLHTKKSPRMPGEYGRRWRRELLDAILRDRETAAINVGRMLEDPGIGAVASAHWRRTGVRLNRRLYRAYLDKLGIAAANRRCEFVAGSIMLLRSNALQRLFRGLGEIRFEDGNGKPARFHVDGQMAHAIERVIGNVIRDLEMRVAWV